MKKTTWQKGTQYKNATIRNKFIQTVHVMTYNTISTQTIPRPCTFLESGKNNKISQWVLRKQNKNLWVYLFMRLAFEIYGSLKSKRTATSKMELQQLKRVSYCHKELYLKSSRIRGSASIFCSHFLNFFGDVHNVHWARKAILKVYAGIKCLQ